MKKIKLTLAALLLSIVTTQAQFYKWINEESSKDDIGYSITKTGSLTVIAGSTMNKKGNSDALFIHDNIDFKASFLFGGDKNDEFCSVVDYDYDGAKYFFYGTTYSYGTDGDNFLVATRGDGQEVFSRIFGLNHTDKANCMKLVHTDWSSTDSKGLLLVGTTNSYNYPYKDLSIILTDLNGVILIQRIIHLGPTNNTEGIWAEQYGEYFYITGTSFNITYVMKLDENLDMVWSNVYYSDYAIKGRCLKMDARGNLIVVGNQYNTSTNGFIMSLNSSNGLVNGSDAKIIHSPTNNVYINNLFINASNQNINYILSGKQINASGEYSILCGLYSFSSVAFGKTNLYGKRTCAYEICANPFLSGGYCFTGYTEIDKESAKDVLYVRTNFLGASLTDCDINSTLSIANLTIYIATDMPYVAYPIAFNVIDDKPTFITKLDYFTKECNPLDKNMQNIDQIIPNKKMLNIFPSPASTQITVSYNDEFIGGTIQLIDVSGKVVYTEIVDNNLTMNISVGNLSKGLYILKVSNCQKYETIKFLKE